SPYSRSTSRTGSVQKVAPLLNKAQLPQGVSAVRPHLEEIDNVPLQVGLFTDSTPGATKEMIAIMQEYGEFVLAVGSSLNVANGSIFGQANVSICVEPLRDDCQATKTEKVEPRVRAVALATDCMKIGANFVLQHQQLPLLSELITACRHRLYSLRIALQFLLLLSGSLSLLVALSAALYLPIVFKPDQMLLFVLISFPLIATSPLLGSFLPRKKFVKIAGKNQEHVNRKEVVGALWSFCIQFLPMILFTLALYFFLLVRHVDFECEFSDLVCSVGYLHDESESNGTLTAHLKLNTEQVRHLVAFQFLCFTIVHSLSWASPLFPVYQSRVFLRPLWLLTVMFLLFLQLIFSTISLDANLLNLITTPQLFGLVVWSICILLVNEVRKLTQRRLFMREQRRRKLAFDTKLGMNSPY
ncbi:unnamed protein product, partial [Mesorhabditis spiculigera]